MHTNSTRSEIILVLLPLLILAILRVAGFDGMLGQDGYAYVDYAKGIKNGLLGGPHPGPFFWPPGYPLLGAVWSLTGIAVPVCLQLISCLSLSGTLILIGRTLKLTHPGADPDPKLTYLLWFGLLTPYFLRNALVTTSDMLACFTVSAVIYYGFKYSQTYKLKDLTLAVTMVSYAVLVRYPAGLVVAPVLMYLLYIWIKRIRKFSHAVALMIPVCFGMIYLGLVENPTGFLSHPAISSWNLSNFFKLDFNTSNGWTQHALPNLVFIFYPFFHPGFIWPGIFFLFKYFKQNRLTAFDCYFWILPYLCYGLFLAGCQVQNPRHLIIVFPMVLIGCYPGFIRIIDSEVIKTYRKPLIVIGISVQLLLCALALRGSYKRNALERQVTSSLSQFNSSPDSTILYSFDMDIALKSRGVPFRIQSLWTEELAVFQKGSLVLFNETKLSKQWRGRNPMINWEKLKRNYTLSRLKSFDDGWELYRIE